MEEQNRERKVLMEQLKHTRALKAQAVARWRDLAKRLTHERAPWHFPENYPRSWELDPTEGPARVRIRLQRCHLNIEKRFFLPEHQDKLGACVCMINKTKQNNYSESILIILFSHYPP